MYQVRYLSGGCAINTQRFYTFTRGTLWTKIIGTSLSGTVHKDYVTLPLLPQSPPHFPLPPLRFPLFFSFLPEIFLEIRCHHKWFCRKYFWKNVMTTDRQTVKQTSTQRDRQTDGVFWKLACRNIGLISEWQFLFFW